MSRFFNVFTPPRIMTLIVSVFMYGFNLFVILHLSKKCKDKVAIVSDEDEITYGQLVAQTESLARLLKGTYELKERQKVGFLCYNHLSFIKAIFACSRLGADVYLLNPKMRKDELELLLREHPFDLVIYDRALPFNVETVSKKIDCDALTNLSSVCTKKVHLKRMSVGKVQLLTSGTTGKPKVMTHTPSFFMYISPFIALVQRLKLIDYKSVYIATPLYHGYGLAILFVFLALGKKIYISKTFHEKRAAALIDEHKIEVITVVPLMIAKMIEQEVDKLSSLRCIVSGSAELSEKLVHDVCKRLGPILYNLYGTSEGGLTTIATPQHLSYSAHTIGKKIRGVPLCILDQKMNKVGNNQIGQLCIYRKKKWMETGDLGYKDENGYYFLCGRTDDMVVSAGINVYPIQLERVMIRHPKVKDVAVIGVKDNMYGQRLKAFITVHSTLTEEELMRWLKQNAATYEMPREIQIVNQLPYTNIGKLDKKRLKESEETRPNDR